jgi:hypothetical protein
MAPRFDHRQSHISEFERMSTARIFAARIQVSTPPSYHHSRDFSISNVRFCCVAPRRIIVQFTYNFLKLHKVELWETWIGLFSTTLALGRSSLVTRWLHVTSYRSPINLPFGFAATNIWTHGNSRKPVKCSRIRIHENQTCPFYKSSWQSSQLQSSPCWPYFVFSHAVSLSQQLKRCHAAY